MALHRINFNLPADLHSRFVATAKREDRTLTVVLVRALEAYIVGREQAGRRQESREPMIWRAPRSVAGDSEGTCPGCREKSTLVPSTGVCQSCSDSAYDRYCPR